MEMVMERTMMNAETMALRTGADWMSAEHGELFKPGHEAEDGGHPGGDEAAAAGTRRKQPP